MRDPIPSTLVTGYLGAGKTTMVDALLHDVSAGRIAVVVNEFGDVGLDRELIVEATEETFALTGAGHLRLRLDPVTTEECRRLPIDRFSARLICTYRGTGTQYGISNDGAAPGRVLTVPTGAPIVLRGTLCPIRLQSGLLHRSPPTQGTNETRLVLVLDPVHDPEDHA